MNNKLEALTKLHVGCGFDHREGYINVDDRENRDPDVVADATDLRMFADRAYKELMAGDLLSRLPKARTKTALLEWNRVLKKGGKLCMELPNILGIAKLLEQKERQTMEAHETLLKCLFGAQSFSEEYRYTGFTELYLRGLLEDAGYDVEAIEPKDEWLFNVVAVKKQHKFPEPIYKLAGKAFIQRLYKVYLKREPDDEAIEFFEQELVDGVAKETIVSRIKHSEEYRSLQS